MGFNEAAEQNAVLAVSYKLHCLPIVMA